MASRRRIKTVPDSGRDLISQLPVEVKERILEFLPIRDAAKTALLSTQWRDVWLGHGQLIFDADFIRCRRDNGLAKTISNILLHRARPVKKFVIEMRYFNPDHNDLDNWLLYLSRNGIEELDMSQLYWNHRYKLPSCIVSCPTIKRLRIEGGFIFCCPVNARRIFPGITSLVFEMVEFNNNVNGAVYSIPNLEKLGFEECTGFSNFQIRAPKLKILSGRGFSYIDESRWFTHHLKAINTLFLDVTLLSCENDEVAAVSLPIAINLQVIKLCGLNFSCGKELTFAMQLLQNSPNLCELGIIASETAFSSCDIKSTSRLLEDLDKCIISQDLKMLNTIKIESFSGSTHEMLFMKMLLSKSPALERVVIQEADLIDTSMVVKILRELLCFPRASPKAQLVCTEYQSMYSLVGYPRF